MLSNTNDMLSEIKFLRVKAKQAEPQFPHRLSVFPILWPTTGLQVAVDKKRVFKMGGDMHVHHDVTYRTQISKKQMLTSVFRSSKKYTFQPSTSISGFFFSS